MTRLKQSDSQKQKNSWRICAIFAPLSFEDSTAYSAVTTIASTLHLLEPLATEIFAITGNFPQTAVDANRIQVINMKAISSLKEPMIVRVPRFIALQLEISYHLAKIAGKVDVVFLAAGASTLFLPTLLAKLLRKKTILLYLGLGALSRQDHELVYEKTLFGLGKHIFPRLGEVLVNFNCRLADRIVTFLKDFDSAFSGKFNGKISSGGSRFYVNIDSFKAEKKQGSQQCLIGYIGRFEKIKGVVNFVKAIPLVLKESAVGFLMGGDGSLRSEVEELIRSAQISDRVTLTGWIPHDSLPHYLNRIRLLVIPSYTEVGPHIVFEAMACGTLVLATPVGVIPDVIRDGETGFIMENNSPECIAKNIVRALNHPRFAEIARSGRVLIEREYTYEAAVGRYRRILEGLFTNNRA